MSVSFREPATLSLLLPYLLLSLPTLEPGGDSLDINKSAKVRAFAVFMACIVYSFHLIGITPRRLFFTVIPIGVGSTSMRD